MPASEAAAPIFALEGLEVGFRTKARTVVKAVRGVSYAVRRGETLGIVGESGSGKSVSLMGAFGLLPEGGERVSGRAVFEGRDVAELTPAERRSILGKDVAFVFQNPMSSLDPVLSVGDQIVEALRIHDKSLSKDAALQRAVELLAHVGITEPERRVGQYPHEFSGGMCQRVMIAMALANRPHMLVADEPTTAVDATIQAQILKLLRDLRTEVSGAVILVSHDLGVISENTDNVIVMYAGLIMEQGPTRAVLENPQHPYTQGLLACRPTLDGRVRLEPIPGQPPNIAAPPPGCPFQPRCPVGRDKEICSDQMPPLVPSASSAAACHFAGTRAFAPGLTERRSSRGKAAGEPLYRIEQAVVEFPVRGPLWRKRRVLRGVDRVDLTLMRGEALGIVGESGSGKSTLARVMMRLITATSGRLVFDGQDITQLDRKGLRGFRDRVQMVFQDPVNSLNPALGVGDNAAEPLRLRGVDPAERRRAVLAAFEEVGLSELHYDRGVTELSGGQLQRVGIARALVLDPDVLIMDEPVSALDVSIQAQILNLLGELKARRGLSYVFISHDMAVVRYLCDRVAVMHLGRLVELGDTDDIFERPAKDYTRRLIAAVPEISAGPTERRNEVPQEMTT